MKCQKNEELLKERWLVMMLDSHRSQNPQWWILSIIYFFVSEPIHWPYVTSHIKSLKIELSKLTCVLHMENSLSRKWGCGYFISPLGFLICKYDGCDKCRLFRFFSWWYLSLIEIMTMPILWLLENTSQIDHYIFIVNVSRTFKIDIAR